MKNAIKCPTNHFENMSKAPGKNAAACGKNHDQAVQNLKPACTFEDSEEEPRKKYLRKTGEYVQGEHLQI